MIFQKKTESWTALALFTLLFIRNAVVASDEIKIDATIRPASPAALAFETGGTSPSGHKLAVNSQYFTYDGKPWFPVMGEFHYSRYPADEWEKEILKMKAGGITVVSTYIFWILHEEVKGAFDWADQRDLHRFVALCAKHRLYVWIRIGPWNHAELRNGGFPDWLLGGKLRENDPDYLKNVETLFSEIGKQVKGQLWKDGGPIVGVQIENEYHPATGGTEHMETLLKFAKDAGLQVPFYTATGWDQATIPKFNYLPIFGGYTEQFWSNSLTVLPPNQNFFFSNIRAEDNVGPDLQPRNREYNDRYSGYPFLTAEMGAGMAIAYHRRPIMQADDSTAAAVVKLGSGISLLGFYMYHGGTNPDGRTSVQETVKAWNGYNDLEMKSYDFQAPIGEFGQVRPTYRTLKALHLFINDFGEKLAPTTVFFPAKMPEALEDMTTPRVTARMQGERGFLFVNNYERSYALAEHGNFQILLKLSSETLTIPVKPVTIPSGAYAIWPVNFALGSSRLNYATAELLCKLNDPETYVFFTSSGVRADFSFQLGEGDAVEAPAAKIIRDKSTAVVSDLPPGLNVGIRVKRANKTVAQIIVLSREQSLNTWKAELGGKERLFLSAAGLYFDGDSIHLSSFEPKDLEVGIYPALRKNIDGSTRHRKEGVFEYYAVTKSALKTAVNVHQTKAAEASVVAKINNNPKRAIAMEPVDEDFDRAAVWTLQVPAEMWASEDRPLLKVEYVGDVARLYAGNRLLDDNFYKGTPFEFGLWSIRVTASEIKNGLTLKILPLRKDTPLYLASSALPAFDGKGEALKLKGVSLLWEYQARLKWKE